VVFYEGGQGGSGARVGNRCEAGITNPLTLEVPVRGFVAGGTDDYVVIGSGLLKMAAAFGFFCGTLPSEVNV
jgi:hypothetical protein